MQNESEPSSRVTVEVEGVIRTYVGDDPAIAAFEILKDAGYTVVIQEALIPGQPPVINLPAIPSQQPVTKPLPFLAQIEQQGDSNARRTVWNKSGDF